MQIVKFCDKQYFQVAVTLTLSLWPKYFPQPSQPMYALQTHFVFAAVACLGL